MGQLCHHKDRHAMMVIRVEHILDQPEFRIVQQDASLLYDLAYGTFLKGLAAFQMSTSKRPSTRSIKTDLPRQMAIAIPTTGLSIVLGTLPVEVVG